MFQLAKYLNYETKTIKNTYFWIISLDIQFRYVLEDATIY